MELRLAALESGASVVMTGYDLNRTVIERLMEPDAAVELAATRTIAGHAEDLDDFRDLLDVLGITRERLVLGMLELEDNLRL